MSSRSAERLARIRELQRNRPRSLLVRNSLIVLAALVLLSWTAGGLDFGDLFSARRRGDLGEFWKREIVPFPLREKGWSWSGLWAWLRPILSERGIPGGMATVWIAVLAVVLAALFGLVVAPFGARSLASDEPYLFSPNPSKDRKAPAARWRVLVALTRALCVGLRAIPEYVWAFLLLAMLGPGAWPAVLALAIHNAGILGRLGAETIENLDRAPLRAMSCLGANRRQITLAVIPPLATGRFFLYLCYRFETCVREATVLGMLGVVSLGYWIQDARARHFHDQMLLLVAVGGLIVLGADIVSHFARNWIRRAR